MHLQLHHPFTVERIISLFVSLHTLGEYYVQEPNALAMLEVIASGSFKKYSSLEKSEVVHYGFVIVPLPCSNILNNAVNSLWGFIFDFSMMNTPNLQKRRLRVHLQ